MRKIEDLHPDLIDAVGELLELCEKNGLKIGIGECLRTVSEQDALYAKGRTAPGSIVTNAKGSTYSSMHQWGVAFDFYRNDGKGAYNDNDGFFAKVGALGKSTGLEWGGDWTSPVDKPHFQLPYWGSTAKTLKALYGTPEIFMRTWEENEMTESERMKFNALVEQVEELTNKVDKVVNPMIYNYIDENMPEWAKPTVEKLVGKGLLTGDENGLHLTDGDLKQFVVNDRAGLYD